MQVMREKRLSYCSIDMPQIGYERLTRELMVRILVSILCLLIVVSSTAQPASGILKIGLKSFTYTDSLASQDKNVIRLLNGLRESSAYDLYFKPGECMKIDTVEGSVRKIIYDQNTNVLYTLMEKGKQKWYCIDSFPDNVYDYSNDLQEYNDMLKSITVSSLPEDQKTIFGFECDKFTVVSPESPDVTLILYRTSNIHMAEIMDPMAEFYPGATLETAYQLPGFTPVIGAVSFTPLKFKRKHFGINLNKYKKVTCTELELEIWNLN